MVRHGTLPDCAAGAHKSTPLLAAQCCTVQSLDAVAAGLLLYLRAVSRSKKNEYGVFRAARGIKYLATLTTARACSASYTAQVLQLGLRLGLTFCSMQRGVRKPAVCINLGKKDKDSEDEKKGISQMQ